MMDRCETFRDCRTTTPLSTLKVSILYTIACGFYGSLNEQNWMCELCTFPNIDKLTTVNNRKIAIALCFL